MTQVNYLNVEFILSFIDNSKIIATAISQATTQAEVVQALQAEQITSMNYLLTNCETAKEAMIAHSRNK